MSKRLALALVSLALALPVTAREMELPWVPEVFSLNERHLDLVYVDVQGSAPFALRGLQREATRILGEIGVNTRWRKGGPSVTASDQELTIVLLDRSPRIPPHVLGATILNDKSVRTVWVYFSHVARALGIDPDRPGAWSGRDVSVLATALGRVVAHEIVHALAPQVPHSLGGLMAERLGRSALMGPGIEVPAEFRLALLPGYLRRASLD